MLPTLSRRRFERHVQPAKSKGIGFNYLLNPACLDNREYTRQGQREIEALLEYIEGAGVSAIKHWALHSGGEKVINAVRN